MTVPRIGVSVDLVILTVRGGRAGHAGLATRLRALLRDGGASWRFHPAGRGPACGRGQGTGRAGRAAGALIHLEQLRTYGYPDRDPTRRAVSVAYLGLAPDLPAPDQPQMSWQPVSALTQMAFDHERILQDGVERARSKLEYTSLAAAFCRDEFTVGRASPGVRDRLGDAARPAQFPPQGHRRARFPGRDRRGDVLRRRAASRAVPARLCSAAASADAAAAAW